MLSASLNKTFLSLSLSVFAAGVPRRTGQPTPEPGADVAGRDHRPRDHPPEDGHRADELQGGETQARRHGKQRASSQYVAVMTCLKPEISPSMAMPLKN